MPPEKMGINTNSNRATIEGADLIFAKEVLLPRQDHLRAVLQAKLVAEFDSNLILDFESPILDDRRHRQQAMKATPWAFTVNEHREHAGEVSLGPKGEVFFMPRGGEFARAFAPDANERGDEEPNGEDSTEREGN